MKIILHVGRHKTGTSAIQTSLLQSRETLLDHGILYPASEFGDIGHFFLPYLSHETAQVPDHYQTIHRMPIDEVIRRAERSWEGVVSEIHRRRPKALVLSAETFWKPNLMPASAAFMERLKALSAEIQVVAYLRSPADLYHSRYMQRMWSTAQPTAPAPFPDRPILEFWHAASGGSLALAVYDRTKLRNRDAVADFCDRYLSEWLPDPSLIPSCEANITCSIPCLELLNAQTALTGGTPDHTDARRKRLLHRIAAMEARHDLRVRSVLKPEIAEQIIRASSDLLWLRETHGITFPDIDYSRIDGVRGPAFGMTAPGFRDICDFDTAKADRLKALLNDDLPAECSPRPDPVQRQGRLARAGRRLQQSGKRLTALIKGALS